MCEAMKKSNELSESQKCLMILEELRVPSLESLKELNKKNDYAQK